MTLKIPTVTYGFSYAVVYLYTTWILLYLGVLTKQSTGELCLNGECQSMSKRENETIESTPKGWDKVEGGTEVSAEQQTINILTEQLSNALKELTAAPKAFDSHFSVEHQNMIAAKYERKYDVTARRVHRTLWPAFTGNPFTMYVLAETLTEAKKAVFSENIKSYLRKLASSMEDYTPTAGGAVLTELQVTDNRECDNKLAKLAAMVEDEDDRNQLLKKYAEQLKLSSKNGKDTDRNKLVFYHAADSFQVVPNTIW